MYLLPLQFIILSPNSTFPHLTYCVLQSNKKCSHHFSPSVTFIFTVLFRCNNNQPLSNSQTPYSSLPLLPGKISTLAEQFHSTFTCLYQSSLLQRKGGKPANKASWFHFKFTTINIKGYPILPSRATMFPGKFAFPHSKCLFCLLKSVTDLFFYLCHSLLTTYFMENIKAIGEKFPHIFRQVKSPIFLGPLFSRLKQEMGRTGGFMRDLMIFRVSSSSKILCPPHFILQFFKGK